LRVVCDREVPCREACGRHGWDEHVARVEAARDRVAGVVKGRLGDRVISLPVDSMHDAQKTRVYVT
jgi:hypothetical protein